jgi:hypothetical protein
MNIHEVHTFIAPPKVSGRLAIREKWQRINRGADMTNVAFAIKTTSTHV